MRLLALLAAVALAAGGCSVSRPSVPSTSLSPASPVPVTGAPAASGSPADHADATFSSAAAQAAVNRLFAAGVAGDRPAWDAGIGALDAAFAVRAGMLFDNLRALRPARLRVHLTGAEQALPAARQATLGTAARVAQAQLTWRLPGERADASSSVWLTFVPGPDGGRLAGTDDGTRLDRPGLPLWWLAPVARVTRGNVTVLVGPGQSADRWADLATRAAADTRTHLPSVQRRSWDGRLVVEVPGSEADFAGLLGAAPAAYATTAAVTRPEGPTTTAAVRVVVNPATAGGTDAELGTTLTHEAVHVATRSAGSPAPLWAVEGLAEYVALASHPGERADELGALRSAPLPSRFPDDGAFTAGGKDVTAAYAAAWLACRAVAEHRDATALGRFYAALAQGRPVAEAARSTLGVGQPTVERWWRDALAHAAAERG